jgi:preprotein translocase subunit SecD
MNPAVIIAEMKQDAVLGKLVGFAITTIVGVLVGVFFTRPAYGELAKYLLVDKKK